MRGYQRNVESLVKEVISGHLSLFFSDFHYRFVFVGHSTRLLISVGLAQFAGPIVFLILFNTCN
jgi:hypothetical protein